MNLRKGLIGHWTMDDRDVSGGTLYDRSAHDNHGSLNGGIVTGLSSPIGESFGFDNTDDYLSVSDSSSLDLRQGFSISVWIKPSNDGMILCKESAWEWRVDEGTIEWAIDTNGWGWVDTGVSAPTGQWTHFTFLYDGADSIVYKNGDLVSTITDDGGGDVEVNGRDLGIGARDVDGTPSDHFGGDISDLRIWDRLLTEAEIEYVYQQSTLQEQSSSLDKDLRGHWSMDSRDTDSGKIRDRSPNDNDGTLLNGATTGNPGVIKESAYFDGTDDGIQVSNDGSLNLGPNCTISLWFNVTDQASTESGTTQDEHHNLIEQWSNGGYLVRIRSGGRLTSYPQNDAGSNPDYNSTNTDTYVNWDEWQHLAYQIAEVDTSTSEVFFYLDGSQVHNEQLSYHVGGTGGQMEIGKWGGTDRNMEGYLDDVRAYSRLLSDSEIERLANMRD